MTKIKRIPLNVNLLIRLQERWRSIVMNASVRVSVCPRTYLSYNTWDRYQMSPEVWCIRLPCLLLCLFCKRDYTVERMLLWTTATVYIAPHFCFTIIFNNVRNLRRPYSPFHKRLNITINKIISGNEIISTHVFVSLKSLNTAYKAIYTWLLRNENWLTTGCYFGSVLTRGHVSYVASAMVSCIWVSAHTVSV